MKQKAEPEKRVDRWVRTLGVASVGLGVPLLWRTDEVARAIGVDDSDLAPVMLRAVGVRELAHAGLLLAGPRGAVWTRVLGDAKDLALLGHAWKNRTGDRRTKVALATAAVAGIALVDLTVARAQRTSQHGPGRPGPLTLEASTTVNRSPEEVYAFWRDLENLPSFMGHLESVTTTGAKTSHWVARGPAGKKVAWDAEITGETHGKRLAWRSLKGAKVDNSGTVHFAPAPGDRGTEVRVVLHYDVPGGLAGRAVARLFGEEPEQQVRDDLRRFKQVMETGDIVRTEVLPHGSKAIKQFAQGAAQPKSGQPKSGQPQSGQAQSGQAQSGQAGRHERSSR